MRWRHRNQVDTLGLLCRRLGVERPIPVLLSYDAGIVTRVVDGNMSSFARNPRADKKLTPRADKKLTVGLVEQALGVAVFLDLVLDTLTGGLSLFFVEIDTLAVFVLFVQASGLNEFLQAGFIGITFLPFFRCLCT